MNESSLPEGYIPGGCNIGPEEIKRRYRIGYIGLALSILFILIAEIYKFPPLWKLALFAPLVYCLSGFIQARQRFCFVYGYKGWFSVHGLSKINKVTDAPFVQADKRKAIRIAVIILLDSMLITLTYYFIST